MPLSDHEQHLLEQMEQQLLADDPRFATTMRGPRRAGGGRQALTVGAVAVVVGLGVVITSITVVEGAATIWLGALGFVVMFAGVIYALSGTGRRTGPTGVVGADGRTAPRPGAPRPGRQRPGGTFMQRLEQRWDQRRDERWG